MDDSEQSRPSTIDVAGDGDAMRNENPRSKEEALSLNELVVSELAKIERSHCERAQFPSACKRLLFKVEGNNQCIDCGNSNPDWATVTFGALVCLVCSGKHRSLGVNVSTVRSVRMDHWSHQEILQMLEGGNSQLSSFFRRHALDSTASTFQSPQLTKENIQIMRYKTKAAEFYREQLQHHIQRIKERGPYKGRRRGNNNNNNGRALGTQTSNIETYST